MIIIALTLKVPETKTAEFTNSVKLVDVANEPPHLDLLCLPSIFFTFQFYEEWIRYFLKICRRKFRRLLFCW